MNPLEEFLTDSMMECLEVGGCRISECFVSLELSGFKNALSRALNKRARPHNDLKRDESAGTHAFRGLSHTFPVKPASCPPDIHLSLEEDFDEAILDTGASRTIIGSDRVPHLLKALRGVEVRRECRVQP